MASLETNRFLRRMREKTVGRKTSFSSSAALFIYVSSDGTCLTDPQSTNYFSLVFSHWTALHVNLHLVPSLLDPETHGCGPILQML